MLPQGINAAPQHAVCLPTALSCIHQHHPQISNAFEVSINATPINTSCLQSASDDCVICL